MEFQRAIIKLERLSRCVVCFKYCENECRNQPKNISLFRLLCKLLNVDDFIWDFNTELVSVCQPCLSFMDQIIVLEAQMEEIQGIIDLKAEQIRVFIVNSDCSTVTAPVERNNETVKRHKKIELSVPARVNTAGDTGDQTQRFRKRIIEYTTKQIRIVRDQNNSIKVVPEPLSLCKTSSQEHEETEIKEEAIDIDDVSYLPTDCNPEEGPKFVDPLDTDDHDWQPSPSVADDVEISSDSESEQYEIRVNPKNDNDGQTHIEEADKNHGLRKSGRRSTVGSYLKSKKASKNGVQSKPEGIRKKKQYIHSTKFHSKQKKRAKLERNKIKSRYFPGDELLDKFHRTDEGKTFYHSVEVVCSEIGYKCSLCEEMTKHSKYPGTAERRIKKHITQRHLNIGMRHCHICSKVFKTSNGLNRHLKNHDKQPKMTCSICRKPCKSESSLTSHLWYHKNEEEKAEAIANGETAPRKIYDNKKTGRTIRELPPITTTEIGKIYYEGIEIFETESGHQCSICEQSEESKMGKKLSLKKLKLHIDRIHMTNLRVRCQICYTEFSSSQEVKDHEQTHFSTTLLKYLCDICGRPYKLKHSVRMHRWLHQSADEMEAARAAGIKEPELDYYMNRPLKFHCTTCGKQFRYRAQLNEHERTHEDRESRRTHMCEECGKLYACPKELHKHVSFVHKRDQLTKIFECPTCNRQFLYKSQLFHHSIKHTGVKPHVCSVCDKGFIAASALARHKAAEHEEVYILPIEYSPRASPVQEIEAAPRTIESTVTVSGEVSYISL